MDVMIPCAMMQQKQFVQSERITLSAYCIMHYFFSNALCAFTKEPIGEQEINWKCMNFT